MKYIEGGDGQDRESTTDIIYHMLLGINLQCMLIQEQARPLADVQDELPCGDSKFAESV